MNFSEILQKYQKQKNKQKNIIIGEFTYGDPTIRMWTDKYKVKIGKFCSFSYNVTIIVDGNHRIDWISTYPFGKVISNIKENPGHPVGKGDIIIGNDVWIGYNALILPGVKIGDGAVIGANSVVTKNVDDYGIVAGNPARHIKYRFTQKQIESLKKIKWWDWPIEKIKANLDLIESHNIDEFIERFIA
jgi:lipopolysaccharide transport system ATP-binding protein